MCPDSPNTCKAEGGRENVWGGAGLEKLERFFLELSIFSLKVCHVDHLLSIHFSEKHCFLRWRHKGEHSHGLGGRGQCKRKMVESKRGR